MTTSDPYRSTHYTCEHLWEPLHSWTIDVLPHLGRIRSPTEFLQHPLPPQPSDGPRNGGHAHHSDPHYYRVRLLIGIPTFTEACWACSAEWRNTLAFSHVSPSRLE